MDALEDQYAVPATLLAVQRVLIQKRLCTGEELEELINQSKDMLVDLNENYETDKLGPALMRIRDFILGEPNQ